ncbi:D-3-phosphoglycerate dehydrogenase [Cimex lectularius]|uniref:D-3-phosphoglycerate dehydrogenase n=1 Tax=Cimex lectularius TaxID=79782 RepID=A0A8I6S691_CIMLE|nr:D-3-phosphoglycerate dehydrogenase [Cimex lectularius]
MALPLHKVLVSDAVDETCVHLLQKYGFYVTCKYKLSTEELIKEIQDYDALIVRSDTKVKAEVLAAAAKLRVVGRAGTGVDNIDTEAATRRGVIVLNTPGGNSVSACELTCALITSLARNVAQGSQSLKEGRWDRKLYTGSELQGKTLAVLGLGRIGREVASRMRGFGMKVVGFDPLVDAEQARALGIEKADLEQIWPVADYITVHTPLIPQTRNLINETTLAKCKKGVKVVNVARGGIVDEKALLNSLKANHCGGAALDVFSEEPPKSPWLLELVRHPKVLATPHLGASTGEAQVRVAVEIAEQLVALSQPDSGFSVTGVVNAPILGDLRDPSNAPWVSLGQSMGAIAAKLVGPETKWADVTLELLTQGVMTKKMRFLTTAVLSGMLGSRCQNGLNLINAPLLAQEAGLKLSLNHTADSDDLQEQVSLKIVTNASTHTLAGTSRGGESWLLSIDDSVFSSGVPLNENTLLFKGSDAPKDCANLIGEMVKNGASVTNMAVALGQSVWISVQTHSPLTRQVKVDNLKSYV